MQLQNNNPTQFNRHGGTAQKQNPYIEEKKATNIYQPDNNTIMASGTMELMNKCLQLTDNLIQKTNQINAINKYNDWKIDYKNITEEYKFDYANNPENGSELTKKYNEKLLKLQCDYEKQISSLHRDSFIKKTNNIYETNNLDLFTKGIDLQYQSDRYINSLNNKLEQSE